MGLLRPRDIAPEPMEERIELDRVLIRTFYVVLPLALLFTLVYLALGFRSLGMTSFLNLLVDVLMVYFFVLGILLYVKRFDRGYIRNISLWLIVAALVLLASVGAVLLMGMGIDLHYNLQPEITGEHLLLDLLMSFVMILATFILAFMIAFGVIGVACALLRRDIPRLLAYVGRMDTQDRSRRNRMAMGTFSIPSIIDIHRVEVGPVPERQNFPYDKLKQNFLFIMYFAVLIPSYVLLNPLFLNQTETVDLVSLAIGASLFIPVAIFPFSVVIDVNARAVNPCRDFHLGKGFKKTIMGFLGWGTVVLLLVLALQITTLMEIASMYFLYLLIAVCVAMIYIFIYYNYFQNDLVNDIVERFEGLNGD